MRVVGFPLVVKALHYAQAKDLCPVNPSRSQAHVAILGKEADNSALAPSRYLIARTTSQALRLRMMAWSQKLIFLIAYKDQPACHPPGGDTHSLTKTEHTNGSRQSAKHLSK